MAFDLDALIAELREREDRRAEVRHLLLGDAPDLQQALTGLARAQAGTERRLEQLTARVDALARQMEQLTARVDALTARVDALARQMEQLTARVDALTARVDGLARQMERLTARVDGLAQQMERLTERVDGLTGHMERLTLTMRELADEVRLLAARMDAVTQRADRAHGYLVERRYAEKGHAYFQRIARRLRRLEPAELDALLASAGVADQEAEEVRYADAVFAGRLRRNDTDGYLVVETSVTIGQQDVTRAHERATILARAGVPAVGVVAGENVAEGASGAARFLGVWQVTDGTVVPPDDGPVAGAA